MPTDDTFYNDTLDAGQQIDTEEAIAALIFDRTDAIDEETAGDLGRDILKLVLLAFRPDLFS